MGILEDINLQVQKGKKKQVKILVQQAIDEGYAPEQILNEALLAGMDVVGEKFRNNEVFVPEMLVTARAMNVGTETIKPYMADANATSRGKICLGTVKGDLHDIGKNLVKMMLEGKGFEVIDLGVDVPDEKFVETVINEDCKILALSALLTTTMPALGDVVRATEEAGIRNNIKIMIGGAPVTQDYCDQIGADAYTQDAASCAIRAVELMDEMTA